MNRSQFTLVVLLSSAVLAPCHADTKTALTAARAAAPAARVVTPTPAVKPVSPASVVNRAALNPQPLPPNPPDPDRVRARKSNAAQKQGIIIIGGKPAAQH